MALWWVIATINDYCFLHVIYNFLKKWHGKNTLKYTRCASPGHIHALIVSFLLHMRKNQIYCVKYFCVSNYIYAFNNQKYKLTQKSTNIITYCYKISYKNNHHLCPSIFVTMWSLVTTFPILMSDRSTFEGHNVILRLTWDHIVLKMTAAWYHIILIPANIFVQNYYT